MIISNNFWLKHFYLLLLPFFYIESCNENSILTLKKASERDQSGNQIPKFNSKDCNYWYQQIIRQWIVTGQILRGSERNSMPLWQWLFSSTHLTALLSCLMYLSRAWRIWTEYKTSQRDASVSLVRLQCCRRVFFSSSVIEHN